MKKSMFCAIASYILLVYSGYSQYPTQLSNHLYMQPMFNTGVSITASAAAQGDMASDGAGHHYVAPAGDGSIVHYLFNNRGNVIHSTTFASNAERPCITAREGRVHVVLHETNLDRIQLWRSTNGGTAWTNVDFRSVSGTLNGLDSFEDERGVHLVYSSDQGIFYHHRTRLTVQASAIHGMCVVPCVPLNLESVRLNLVDTNISPLTQMHN